MTRNRSSHQSRRAVKKARPAKTCLVLEFLEDRTLPSNGQWLAVFGGISPGTSLAEQAAYGQSRLHSAGILVQDVRVVEALDLSGSFVVQTPPNVSQQVLTGELDDVAGFVFAADFTPEVRPPSTDIPGPLTRQGYETLFGPFDYDAFVAREQAGEVPDGSGPVDSPCPPSRNVSRFSTLNS